MKKPSLLIVKCDKCGRYTHIFGKTKDGKKLCPVCITELQDQKGPRVGPSEVKDTT